MECRWWDSGEGRTTLLNEGSKQAAQSQCDPKRPAMPTPLSVRA